MFCESLPLPLVLFRLVVVLAPPTRWEDVNGRGYGEGSSSTDSEWGFKNGPLSMAPFAIDAIPPVPGVALASGVGGGDVPPSLLRSLRVI